MNQTEKCKEQNLVETTKKIPSSDEIYYPESVNYREKKVSLYRVTHPLS